jgi:hypothetical protein
MAWWWTFEVAIGGSGPWVVGEGAASLYLGAEVQQFSRLRIDPGEAGVVEDVAEGVATFGLKAIGSIGLSPRAEIQLALPWYQAYAHRVDAAPCADLGLGACRTTTAVGVLEARAKVLLVDEFFGAPLSFAVGPELRVGAFTHGTRQRITNIGEGTTDVGLFLDVGRTGAVGSWVWSTYLEGLGRYRIPNTESYPNHVGTNVAPGSEVGGSVEVLLGPSPFVSFGPASHALYRPTGLEWEELDFGDPDRFAALRIANVRVGGLVVVRNRGDVSGSLSILRTVGAYNNPTDTWIVSLGIQVNGRLRRRPDE